MRLCWEFQWQPAHEATWKPRQQPGQFVPSEAFDTLVDGGRSYGRRLGAETRASPPSREKTPPRRPSFSRLPPGGFLLSSVDSVLFLLLSAHLSAFISSQVTNVSRWLNDYLVVNCLIFNRHYLVLSFAWRCHQHIIKFKTISILEWLKSIFHLNDNNRFWLLVCMGVCMYVWVSVERVHLSCVMCGSTIRDWSYKQEKKKKAVLKNEINKTETKRIKAERKRSNNAEVCSFKFSPQHLYEWSTCPPPPPTTHLLRLSSASPPPLPCSIFVVAEIRNISRFTVESSNSF